MLQAWWNNDRHAGAGSHVTVRNADAGVVETDNRLVFAALAVGMIVGALLLTPAKTPATALLKAPGSTSEK
jgi:hypothetical protein